MDMPKLLTNGVLSSEVKRWISWHCSFHHSGEAKALVEASLLLFLKMPASEVSGASAPKCILEMPALNVRWNPVDSILSDARCGACGSEALCKLRF